MPCKHLARLHQITSLAFLLLVSPPASANDQMAEVGRPPNQLLEIGQFDSINLLNGSLHFEYPLYSAQLDSGFRYDIRLAYNNSGYWQTDPKNPEDGERISRKSALGLGFTLHLGRVYPLCDFEDSHCKWFYEDPSGTPHRLFREDVNGVPYYWSKDTTFIRALRVNSGGIDRWEVSLPDGTLHLMEYKVSGNKRLPNFQGYYTTRINAPVNPAVNNVLIVYDAPTYPHCIRQITDSLGRQIFFHNTNSLQGSLVDGGYTYAIDVPAINGQRALYSLDHALNTIRRPIDQNGSPFYETDQLMLSGITLPNGTDEFQFTYLDPDSGVNQGEVTSLHTPLGAELRYRYATRFYVKISFNSNPGCRPCLPNVQSSWVRSVNRRTVVPAEPGLSPSVWAYTRTRFEGGIFASVVRTRVIDPFGNLTKHYFYSVHSSGDEWGRWDDGLAYRTEYYQGPEDPLNLVRTEETDYDYDPPPQEVVENDNIQAWNVRVRETRTIYNDDTDGNNVARVENALWDGFHWKERREYDFDGTHRTSFTEYTVPTPTTNKWVNWVINTYSVKEVRTDAGAVAKKSSYTFDDFGRLTNQVDYYSPGNDSDLDIITSFSYDSPAGNLVGMSVDYRRGGSPYSTSYGYSNGSRNQEQISGVAWKALDQDIDFNSGLVVRSRDSALAETSYSYDVLGRLTLITPPSALRPTAIEYPTLLDVRVSRGIPGTSDYLFSRSLYDSLGRRTEVRRLGHDGVARLQRVAYDDPTHRISFRSEWLSCQDILGSCEIQNPAGTFYSYTRFVPSDPAVQLPDVLGRVQRVTTADNKVQRMSYVGLDRTVIVEGINNTSQAASTTYRTDAFGRLTAVLPPTEAARAIYSYDVLDRLVGVSLVDQNDPLIPLQPRSRSYDALGRLLEKTDPESGTTSYPSYSATGKVLEETRADGTRLRYQYDPADRMSRVELYQPYEQYTVLKEITYQNEQDPANLHGPGAFGRPIRFVSFPDSGLPVIVTRELVYDNLGRVTTERNTFSDWATSGEDPVLETHFAYDDFGRISQLTYPQVTGSPRTPTRTAYTYTHGFLTRLDANRLTNDPSVMSPVVNAILYSDSGTPTSLALANGVQEVTDTDVRDRPQRMRFWKGSTLLWDSGDYEYDGAANIRRIGTQLFTYDLAERLIGADTASATTPGLMYHQVYQYDAFGNMVDRAGDVSGHQVFRVDPVSNRITGLERPDLIPPLQLNYSYSPDGELQNDGIFGYGWDSLQRLQGLHTVDDSERLEYYEYDDRDYRVRVATDYGARQTLYVRDPDGRVLSEFASPTSLRQPQWRKDYIYALGRNLAAVENTEPETPTGLTSSASPAETTCSRCAKLSWVASNTPDLYGYDVYRSPDCDLNSFVRITSVPVTATTFSDVSMDHDGTFCYKIVSVDEAAIESLPTTSRKIMVGDSTPPTVPAEFTAQGTCNNIVLSWAPSTDAQSDLAGYNLYRRVLGSSSWPSTPRNGSLPLQTTTFIDTTGRLTGTAPFEYRLDAVDAAGQVSATTTTADMPDPEECGGGMALFVPSSALSLPTSASLHRIIGDTLDSESSCRLKYYHVDHLGTPRLTTDSLGFAVNRVALLPFGEASPDSELAGDTHWFTGHERDRKAQLDYMLGRYYGSSLARFISSDPKPSSARTNNPQSWNRYSYALANPLRFLDPGGLDQIEFGSKTFNVNPGDVIVLRVGRGSGLHTATYVGGGKPGEIVVVDNTPERNQNLKGRGDRTEQLHPDNTGSYHGKHDVLSPANGKPSLYSPEQGTTAVGIVPAKNAVTTDQVVEAASTVDMYYQSTPDLKQCSDFTAAVDAKAGTGIGIDPAKGPQVYADNVDPSKEIRAPAKEEVKK